MWIRTLALIALAPAMVSAKTSIVARDSRAGEPSEADETATRIFIGAPNANIEIDKLRVVIAGGETVTVRLAITVATTSSERQQAVIPLALPDGARIAGGAVTIGTGERVSASTLTPDAARESFQWIFQVGKDPLLVEQVGATHDTHAIAHDAIDETHAAGFDAFATQAGIATERAGFVNYVVRAFPLTDDDKARIELTFELPARDAREASRLVIAHAARIGLVEVETAIPGAHSPVIRARRDVRAPIAIALPATRPLPVGVATVTKRGVDLQHSLYAGWAPSRSGPVPTVTIDHPQRRDSSVDAREIRRMVKQHLPQLERCYSRVTQFQGGQEGTAVMHFLVDTSGKIASVTVDGEIDDTRITSCLEQQVRLWELHPGDTAVMVNYPLQFRLWRP